MMQLPNRAVTRNPCCGHLAALHGYNSLLSEGCSSIRQNRNDINMALSDFEFAIKV